MKNQVFKPLVKRYISMKIDSQRRKIFTNKFRYNLWGGSKSRSGPGSDLDSTDIIRKEIPHILKKYEVKRLLDLPCGDFHWIKEIELPIEQYIGGDIVREIVLDNKRKYESEKITFRQIDIVKDPLPDADMIIVRDCFIHFSFKLIQQSLKNIRSSRIKYLLTTIFVGQTFNDDIKTGQWRPLNLFLPPFNFPDPLELINEQPVDINLEFKGKSLGLWKIDEL